MREVLTRINGVSDVKTSLPDREARVAYNAAKTTPEQLARALTDHQGDHDFTARVKQ